MVQGHVFDLDQKRHLVQIVGQPSSDQNSLVKSRLELEIVLKGEKLEVDRKERRLLQFGSPSLHTDVSPEETRPLPRRIMGRLTVNCLFFLGLFFLCVCVYSAQV